MPDPANSRLPHPDADTVAAPPAPPFSPFLLIGLALRPLPRQPLQMLASAAMRVMAARHPDIFGRLRSLGPAAIAIDPTDLPFMFWFQPNGAGERLRLMERNAAAGVAATIRGPFSALLALLEGDCDGDALFFSRVLTVEGDMTVALTLRNAIDGAQVNLLSDFAAIFGRADRVVERLLRFPRRLAGAMSRDAAMLQSAINAPLASDVGLQAAAVRQLRGRLDTMERELRRLKQRREA